MRSPAASCLSPLRSASPPPGCDPHCDDDALPRVRRGVQARPRRRNGLRTGGLPVPRPGDWARQQQLKANQRVFLPSFLEDLAAYARELGHEGAKAHSASGGTVLAEDLPVRELPPRFALRELSLSEQEQLRAGGEFDNALGEPEERRRIAASRIAFAVVDSTGAPVAVTGIWDQYPGVDELGLDVLRAFRGNGFAAILTIHATRWIRSQGRLPIYTYGFTNVRSMNNALSCGYRPLWFIAPVYVPSDMTR